MTTKREGKTGKKWDGRTDSNSSYFLLRRKGLSHAEAGRRIEEF